MWRNEGKERWLEGVRQRLWVRVQDGGIEGQRTERWRE